MEPFRVACIQNCAEDDIARNLAECSDLVRAAAAAGARLVCLPEYFAGLYPNDEAMLAHAFTEAAHPALPHFCALAREFGVWILMGSIPVRIAANKVNNRSYLIDDAGSVILSYNKLH